MSEFDFDLITIGAGSGGVRASRFAAQFGARVAIIESAEIGGTCVNLGCIPKKLLSYAAHYHEDFEDARGYGWTPGTVHFDWPTLIAAKDQEIARLNAAYERGLRESGVTVLRGVARLSGPQAVRVGDQTLTARRILIATGGRPVRPALPGSEHMITSNEAFHLAALPRRCVVYGAGYIAVEFASIFNGLGATTSLVHRSTHLLRAFDAEIGPRLAEEMGKKGVRLYPGNPIERIEPLGPDGPYRLFLADGTRLEADCVLAATGRAPNSAELGLEALGIALGPRREIVVDSAYTTSIATIHAIGDVTDRIQLTPVALAEGMAFADRWFGSGARQVSYENVATAVFSHPNIACVGLTEENARAAGHSIRVFKSDFRALRHTLSGRTERTFLKIVVDAENDRVLGIHMLGPDAGEIIQGFAVAMTCGVTKAQLDQTIGIHPTIAEEFLVLRKPAS